jgi:hypothetical protein
VVFRGGFTGERMVVWFRGDQFSGGVSEGRFRLGAGGSWEFMPRFMAGVFRAIVFRDGRLFSRGEFWVKAVGFWSSPDGFMQLGWRRGLGKLFGLLTV